MNFLFNDIQKQTITLVMNTRVFSIMFDSATDVSTIHVCVRFVDKGIPPNVYVD